MRPYPFTSAAMSLLVALPVGTLAADTNPLVAERWKSRPVVVVVPRGDDPLLSKVNAALEKTAAREAFRERDMTLYTVVAGSGSRDGEALPAGQTRALLDALRLDPRGPATFLLVGKDGGVKLTDGRDVDLQAVFAEIDRMPMRQPR